MFDWGENREGEKGGRENGEWIMVFLSFDWKENEKERNWWGSRFSTRAHKYHYSKGAQYSFFKYRYNY